MEQLKTLTSLRFFCAAGVVMYHIKQPGDAFAFAIDSFNFAHLVSFFFVLSGFVLALRYQTFDSAKQYRRFYWTRFLRIWPAHAFSLFLLLMLVPEVFDAKGANFPLFVTNLALIQSWSLVPKVYFSYNSASWSNSTEFFFYLLFPLTIVGLRKKTLLTYLLVTIALVVPLIVSSLLSWPHFSLLKFSSHGLLYVFPLTRFIEFFAGILLGKFWLKTAKSRPLQLEAFTFSHLTLATMLELACLTLVLTTSYFSNPLQHSLLSYVPAPLAFWFSNCGLPVLGWLLVIFCFAQQKGLVSMLLQLPIFIYLGEISFTIYMLHGVLITWHEVYAPHLEGALFTVAFWIVLILLSHLVSYYFERPLRSLLLTSKHTPENQSTVALKYSGQWFPLIWRLTIICIALQVVLPHHLYVSHASASATDSAIDSSLPRVVLGKSQRYLELCSSKVTRLANGLKIHLVWQSHERGPVDFFETVVVNDKDGEILRSQTHSMDVWKTVIDPASTWVEDFTIPVSDPSSSRLVRISLVARKKPVAILCPVAQGTRLQDYALLGVELCPL